MSFFVILEGMSKGLHIKESKNINIANILFWLIFISLLLACGWYGYRFYTKGELPPVPIPVATAKQDVIESPISNKDKDEHKVPPLQPRFLSIDSLNVHNSRVHSVGVAKNGELATPANIFDTGWHKDSALPGEDLGALLMDGHNGGPTKDGVFKNLPSLKRGSTIVIERGDGKKVTYRTESVKVVTLEELNNGGMSELTKSIDIGVQGLNIISCTGNWVPAMQTYDERVVVRAVQVEQ